MIDPGNARKSLLRCKAEMTRRLKAELQSPRTTTKQKREFCTQSAADSLDLGSGASPKRTLRTAALIETWTFISSAGPMSVSDSKRG